MKRPQAGDWRILLGRYIKLHARESFVRVQLDRGELPYTWTDSDNNARASDDGGPVPQKVLPKVPPELRRRWEKLGSDGRPKPPVSRKVIYGAYQDYLKAHSSK